MRRRLSGRRQHGRRPVVTGVRASLRARRLLRRAHQLFERGRFRDAADEFLRLATGAEGLGLDRAPFLYLQAGRARVLATDVNTGLSLLLQGFKLLADSDASGQLVPLGKRAVDELQRLGHLEHAQKLEAELLTLAEPDAWQAVSAPAADRRLPAKCGFCGANLFPEDLELRGGVPICSYCGSPAATDD